MPPRCRVECRELEKSDEVVVFDTGDDEFVVLEVVEERVNTFVMLKMSSSVGLPTIGVNSVEAVAKSNAVAVAYVDAIVVGGRWPERSALSWSWLYV